MTAEQQGFEVRWFDSFFDLFIFPVSFENREDVVDYSNGILKEGKTLSNHHKVERNTNFSRIENHDHNQEVQILRSTLGYGGKEKKYAFYENISIALFDVIHFDQSLTWLKFHVLEGRLDLSNGEHSKDN